MSITTTSICRYRDTPITLADDGACGCGSGEHEPIVTSPTIPADEVVGAHDVTARKLRAAGVTHVALDINPRLPEFSIAELLRSAGRRGRSRSTR